QINLCASAPQSAVAPNAACRCSAFARFNPLGIRYLWQIKNQCDFFYPHRLTTEIYNLAYRAPCTPRHPTHVDMVAMRDRGLAARAMTEQCETADTRIVIEPIPLEFKAGGNSSEWRNHQSALFCAGCRVG